ncbi:hypothetical protein E1B28_013488 [Marasmius oreades]|uniref:Phosducin domain-containing protein n=1 Tax=Marasmius oreades TaxID=181124 RepID=A0A9P7UPY2_9AGAR|nr:uncharacterized protein E1B28_013488 [Marasmius oreades]KAG7087529.1 hypothetical protein E1B28_013488 [Marasmius oreades]
MYADIEALVLSGELFNGKSRSSSPTRSDSSSSDQGWHDEHLDEKLSQSPAPQSQPQQESIGMGPGRTGVKGVIRDRDEAREMERERRGREMEEMRKKMEKSSLGGKTFLEEEREKGLDEKVDPLVEKERERVQQKVRGSREDVFGRAKEGKFGHLREVGRHNFVAAVEKEARGVWVVLHLYDGSLDRCYALDDTLTRLAPLYPDTKFLRSRASALGFARLHSTSQPQLPKTTSRPPRSRHGGDDGDDPYGDLDELEADKDSEDSEEYDEDNVDLDMLPTMLVYRDGELVFNWVRVDWEAKAGVEDLLSKHHVIPQTDHTVEFGGFGIPSDDEFEETLLWDSD